MHRVSIDDGAVNGRYVSGDGQQVAGTRITEGALNSFQEEIASAIEGYGVGLDASNNAQLYNILKTQVVNNITRAEYNSSFTLYRSRAAQDASPFPSVPSLEEFGNPRFVYMILYGSGGSGGRRGTNGNHLVSTGISGEVKDYFFSFSDFANAVDRIDFSIGAAGANTGTGPTHGFSGNPATAIIRDGAGTAMRTFRASGGTRGHNIETGSGANGSIIYRVPQRRGQGGDEGHSPTVNTAGGAGGFYVIYFS